MDIFLSALISVLKQETITDKYTMVIIYHIRFSPSVFQNKWKSLLSLAKLYKVVSSVHVCDKISMPHAWAQIETKSAYYCLEFSK